MDTCVAFSCSQLHVDSRLCMQSFLFSFAIMYDVVAWVLNDLCTYVLLLRTEQKRFDGKRMESRNAVLDGNAEFTIMDGICIENGKVAKRSPKMIVKFDRVTSKRPSLC